jgi:hypothetical protein
MLKCFLYEKIIKAVQYPICQLFAVPDHQDKCKKQSIPVHDQPVGSFPWNEHGFLVENYLLPLIPPLLYETTALVK